MSRIRVSHSCFSSLQWLSVSAPIVFLLLLGIAFTVIAAGKGSLWISVLESIFYVLTCGGIALMYLAWWISMTFRGIVATPKTPWQLDVEDGIVAVRSKRLETFFRIERPREYVEVWDGGFDSLKGLEDKGLVIDFGFLSRIVVPGSSTNFNASVAKIKNLRPVRFKEIE
jgi:hypothetical protein